MHAKYGLLAVAFGVVLLTEREARACGAAYPGGPVFCTMADAPGNQAKGQPPLHVSLSWAYTTTTILFGEGRRVALQRHALFAGTEVGLGRGYALRFGAGGIVAGELESRGEVAAFGPGVTGFVGVAKTVVDEGTYAPFVQLGATLSGSRVATRGPRPNEAPSFTAFDLRAAVVAGKTLGPVVVYTTARAFGGPVYYELAGRDVTGTDLYKYQLGGGLSFALPSRVLDLFVEGIAFGERGLAAGLGTTF